MSDPSRHRLLTPRLAAAVVCLVLVLFWGFTLETPSTWGWDESMHAELPAVRMLLGAKEGGVAELAAALHDCERYPFGWPLVLAALQGVFGISELVCRLSGIAVWGLALFGLFLLGEELARAQRSGGAAAPPRGDRLLPWVALAFGALSPLALHYSATLFLEVPFTCCAIFALRAWLRRREGGVLRELAAGLWLTAALFTKFNYGILLGFGCALDLLVQGIGAVRAGDAARFLRRTLFLAAPPVVLCTWWLLLPLPFGAEVALKHREALVDFLGGNQQLVATPWTHRALHWTLYLALTARLLAVQVLGLLLSIRDGFRPGARLLWVVFLGGGIPVWTHNFHLERFLIPGAPALWLLAALGLVRVLPHGRRAREVVLASLALGVLLFPSADARYVAEGLGVLAKKPEVRTYQLGVFESWARLGSGRPLPSAGLEREVAEAIWPLVRAEAGPEERVGWLGVSTEFPPAAIHLALLDGGGSRRRFLSDAHRPMDVTFEGVDPGLSDEALAEHAKGFDVIFTTAPPDLRGRPSRQFIAEYARRVVETLGWSRKALGAFELPRLDGSTLPVTLFALRPPR